MQYLQQEISDTHQRMKIDMHMKKFFQIFAGDGYYESCIVGIEGNQIEITV